MREVLVMLLAWRRRWWLGLRRNFIPFVFVSLDRDKLGTNYIELLLVITIFVESRIESVSFPHRDSTSTSKSFRPILEASTRAATALGSRPLVQASGPVHPVAHAGASPVFHHLAKFEAPNHFAPIGEDHIHMSFMSCYAQSLRAMRPSVGPSQLSGIVPCCQAVKAMRAGPLFQGSETLDPGELILLGPRPDATSAWNRGALSSLRGGNKDLPALLGGKSPVEFRRPKTRHHLRGWTQVLYIAFLNSPGAPVRALN